MKIAVLTCYNPTLIHFRLDMMRSFVALGHQVVVIGNEPEREWAPRLGAYDIKYRAIKMRRNGLNPFSDWSASRQLQKVLREEKPDKIFSAQAKMVIYGGIAAHKLGITEYYPLIAGLGSVFLGRGLKFKVVRGILTREYRTALKYTKKVFFQNRDDSQFFVENRIVPEEKVVYLNGSGVNLEVFTPLPLPEKSAFLCVSRLVRDKGVMEYLDACRIVRKANPAVRCLLVGPFDTNPSAIRPEDLQSYLDDGSVEYFGEQNDVRPYLAQSTVFVLPSYREGTPKSVLEAMACARAAITTDAPGCRETVTDGVNGVLVPVKDVPALAKAMLDLSQNPELCREMGQKGHKIAETRFDVRRVNQKILETMNLIGSDCH